jgi:glutathione S-transferase
VRARIARWLYWESGHWQPVLAALLAPWVGHRLLPDVVPRPAVKPNWDAAELRPLLGALSNALNTSAFLVGNEVTIADFAVAGMVTYFRTASFPFQEHPRVMDWYSRIEMLDGWRATQDSLWSV